MNLEDVVKLIESCKNAGVAKLKWEKLELCFHPSEVPKDANAKAVPSRISRVVEQEIDEDQDLNDLELQNLMINDPMAYEAYIRKSGHVQVGERA